MDYKTICETDADFLLELRSLENNGFAFRYAKWKDNVLQQYVNCNGKIFGPFEDMYHIHLNSGKAQWTVYQSDIIMEFSDNGNKCETRKHSKSKNSKGTEVLSQTEIHKLLSAIAGKELEEPEEEYDDETHVLTLNRKNQQFFVTDKDRFGPYHKIFKSEYLDEEHFQFTYKKRNDSGRWYYNCNGKEIGPFHIGTGYANMIYDERNRAILDDLKDGNYIFIDGKKIKCFTSPCFNCQIFERNGHEIFTGFNPKDGARHFKRDGIESTILAGSIVVLDNGDIVYCKLDKETQTWFYNENQISVPVKGHSSYIENSIVLYKRKVYQDSSDIPFFMMEGKEYNGDTIKEGNLGFAWLQNGKILFLPQVFPIFALDCVINENYRKQRDGNFLRLFYTHRLAGRD